MDGRLTRTNCDEVGDYVVPNVLSPRDLVPRPDNMDELYYHQLSLRIRGNDQKMVVSVSRERKKEE